MDLREALHLEINQPGTITKSRLRTILNDTYAPGGEPAPTPVVSNIEGLRELPNTAVIRDKHGDVSERRLGRWCGYECGALTDEQMAKYLPATILDRGRS